jgi:hypothetical protein
MSPPSSVVRQFFDTYARSRTAFDIDAIALQYADAFMFAGPDGARVVDKPSVLAAAPKGQEWLKSLGHTSTDVLTLDESGLDRHYVLVHARFAWRFQKTSAEPRDVKVDSTFILYMDQGAPQIVFQHEPVDFQQALRASGVLPAQS